MEKIDWDDYFMTMTYLVAMRSKDESTHVGAVIVGPDNEIRSTGYNSFPRRINDDVPERQQRPEKYFWFSHGERNSIYNAAMVGIPVKGCRMYTNGVPCNDCAWGIINCGIAEVIVDKSWDDNNYAQWLEHAVRSRVMFEESGVKLRFWEGKMLDIHRFRGGEKF
jgi:dCMP deaminase